MYQAVVELTEIKAGELVVVTGPGPIGLLAKVRGVRVLVLGTGADAVRLDCARSLGADIVLDVEQEDAAEVVYLWWLVRRPARATSAGSFRGH